MKCYKCEKELPPQFTVTANSFAVHNQHAWRMINPNPAVAAGLGVTQMVPVCIACDPYPMWFMPQNEADAKQGTKA